MVIRVLRKLSDKIVSYLVDKKKIDKSESELYRYGLELLISNGTALLIVLSVGILLSVFYETILFLILFYLLRKFGGGYHAKTMLRCMILTIIVHLLFILLLKVNMSFFTYQILWIQIILLYILFVPQNSDIEETEYNRFKLINLCLMGIGMLLCMKQGTDSRYTYIITYPFYITGLANLWEGGKSMLEMIKKIAIKNLDNCSPWEFFKPEKPSKNEKNK